MQKIVNFSPELRGFFESLNREWLERYFSVEPIDIEYFESPEDLILAEGGEIFFAEVDGEILGTCSVVRTEEGFEMAKMAVTAKAQGKGLGRLLAEEAIARAKRMGAEKLMLVTNSQLAPAVGLYRALGFEAIHEGPHPKYRRGNLVMEKNLH